MRRSSGGFTLIEVLVALTIVAIALGAGLKASAALASNAQRLTDVIAAQWCADNQLADIHLSQQFVPVGESEFKCDQMGFSYRGQLVVRSTPNPNFRRVDAHIRTESGVPLLTLTTVVSKH